jgi:CheY-like chemotaxis protein
LSMMNRWCWTAFGEHCGRWEKNGGWSFATSGREALEILAGGVFDVIVTDMRMPGLDGCQLLNQARKLYPNTVRIILSGQSDKEELLKSIDPIHLYLSKPCDAEILKAALARTFAVRHLLKNDSLADVISKIQSLPSLPSLYLEIIDEIRSADGSLARVGEIISKDLGMSAKILQLVNSSFFGLQHTYPALPRPFLCSAWRQSKLWCWA